MSVERFRDLSTGVPDEATSVNVTRRPIAGASENFTSSGSNQQSTAMPAGTRAVRIAVLADTWVAISANPNATTTTDRWLMPAGAVEYFDAKPGDEVGFVQVTAAGVVSVAPTN